MFQSALCDITLRYKANSYDFLLSANRQRPFRAVARGRADRLQWRGTDWGRVAPLFQRPDHPWPLPGRSGLKASVHD